MPLPKGDVHKKKEIVQDVTLHDLDVANARPQVCGCATRPQYVSAAALTAAALVPGRPGHPVHDGTTDEAQEDGDHRWRKLSDTHVRTHARAHADDVWGCRQAADRDQQGGEPLHRPGRRRAGARRAFRGRGAHAGHRVLHIPAQSAGEHHRPHRGLRLQQGKLSD